MFLTKLMFSLLVLLKRHTCYDIPVQDCWTSDYDILVVYDCREIGPYLLHVDIFIKLMDYFSFNKGLRFSLGTYGNEGIQVIKSFDDNAPVNMYSLSRFTEYECPSSVTPQEIFQMTRQVLSNSNGRQKAKKMALVILNKEERSFTTETSFTDQLDFLQYQEMDIRRLFLIMDKTTLKVVKNMFIFTQRDEHLYKIMNRIIGSICSSCRPDTLSLSYTYSGQTHKKCYLLMKTFSVESHYVANKACEKEMFRLLTVHSQDEVYYLRSALPTILFKLNIYKATFFTNLKEYLNYPKSFEDSIAKNYKTFNLYIKNIEFCIFWRFQRSPYIKETFYDHSQILNGSVINNETMFLDEFFEENCKDTHKTLYTMPPGSKITIDENRTDKKLQDNILLCEFDLSNNINPIGIYELGYETVGIEQVTLIPKHYFLLLLKDIFAKDNHFKKVKQMNCTTNSESTLLCQHVMICHSLTNNSRDFCDGPVQYIYKHRLVTEYLNYFTFRSFGSIKGLNGVNSLQSQHTETQSQRSSISGSKNATILPDYTFSDDVEVKHCNYVLSSETTESASNLTEKNCFLHQDSTSCYKLASKKDCSDIICPPNFVKCPGSNCAYLGYADWKMCSSPNYVKIVDNDTPLCLAEVQSVIKRTCTDLKLTSRQVNTKAIDCDFDCGEGFTCLSQGIMEDDESVYFLHVFHQTVKIFKILDRYRIQANMVTLLNLIEHFMVRAPNCNIGDMHQWFREWDISQLVILDLSFNNLTSKDLLFTCAIKTLRHLNVSNNRNLTFPANARFHKLLETIDLSYTSVDKIPQAAFKASINLKYLYLRQTRVTDIYSIGVSAFFSLNILDLRDIFLRDIKSDFFQGLSINSSLFVNDYKLCCPQVTGPNIPQDKCYSPPGPLLSSCKDLIGDSNKRIVLWCVGIVAFIGNLFVVVYRLVWDREVLKKAYGVFVTCLGVYDLIIGIYLLVVAAADSYFRSLYVLNDTRWRYGNICKFAGFLATFSSESSAFFICLITIDRYLIMRYPFGEHRISNTDKIRAVVITWTFSFLLALIPTFPLDWDIYTSNSMCLALPINNIEHGGWLYSFCVLILLNFLTFLIIFIGQILVFIWFSNNKMPNNSMISNSRSNDISIAKNLAFVAISDFMCWFPIAIMGFMSLGGYMFGNEAYSWSAVFVIPVNSALNPIIYTLPALQRKIGTSISFC